MDRLEDLAKAPSLAEGLGLPRSCFTKLSAALGDGRAAADALALGPLPPGWETRISSSTGLSYFVNKDGAQRWDRPAPPDDPEEPLDFPVAPSAAEDLPVCAEWKELETRAQPLLREMQQGPSTLGQQSPMRRSALQVAWRGEMLAALRGKGASSGLRVQSRIEAVFWHRVVEPCIASLGSSNKCA